MDKKLKLFIMLNMIIY